MDGSLCERKVEIDYPCQWVFKVIGMEPGPLRAAIAEVLRGHEGPVSVEPSRSSGGGRYCSFNLELTLRNDEERLGYYQRLSACAAIKVIL